MEDWLKEAEDDEATARGNCPFEDLHEGVDCHDRVCKALLKAWGFQSVTKDSPCGEFHCPCIIIGFKAVKMEAEEMIIGGEV